MPPSRRAWDSSAFLSSCTPLKPLSPDSSQSVTAGGLFAVTVCVCVYVCVWHTHLVDDVCCLVVSVHQGPVVGVHLSISNGALKVVAEPVRSNTDPQAQGFRCLVLQGLVRTQQIYFTHTHSCTHLLPTHATLHVQWHASLEKLCSCGPAAVLQSCQTGGGIPPCRVSLTCPWGPGWRCQAGGRWGWAQRSCRPRHGTSASGHHCFSAGACVGGGCWAVGGRRKEREAARRNAHRNMRQ